MAVNIPKHILNDLKMARKALGTDDALHLLHLDGIYYGRKLDRLDTSDLVYAANTYLSVLTQMIILMRELKIENLLEDE